MCISLRVKTARGYFFLINKHMKQLKLTGEFDIMSNSSEETAFQIGTALLQGDLDPIQLAIFVKKMEKVCKLLFESGEITDTIFNSLHGVKTYEAYGAYIQEAILHSKYDYEAANHLEYNELTRIEKVIKNRKKEIETYLKTIHGTKTEIYEKMPVLLYEDDGTMDTIYEVPCTIKRGYKFTV